MRKPKNRLERIVREETKRVVLEKIIKESIQGALNESPTPKSFWAIMNSEGLFRTRTGLEGWKLDKAFGKRDPRLFESEKEARDFLTSEHQDRPDSLGPPRSQSPNKEVYVGGAIVEYVPGKIVDLDPQFMDRDEFKKQKRAADDQLKVKNKEKWKKAEKERLKAQLAALEK